MRRALLKSPFTIPKEGGDFAGQKYFEAEDLVKMVFIEVDAKGNPIKIRSKWGHYSLFEHAPDAVPAHYGKPSYYHKK